MASLSLLTPPDAPPTDAVELPARLTEAARRRLDAQLAGADGFVPLVSTFRAGLGDAPALAVERYAVDRLRGAARVVIFRPGRMTTPGPLLAAFLWPLVPGSLRHCFLDPRELDAAIVAERAKVVRHRPRVLTLLGANRPWREVLRERAGGAGAVFTALGFLLSLTLLGRAAALLVKLLGLRRWHLHTLEPASFRELLGLVNPYNHRFVKVVGYNNGVNHFGHRYPGQTVVSTVKLNRVARTGPDAIRADAGTTIRRALDFLARSGQTLFVVPNYSYVALGTAYFVPIHGSAADYSCVAETIEQVVLLDPPTGRVTVARRGTPAFDDHVYRPEAGAILLRLELRVKPQSHYFLHREERQNPPAADLLAALTDDRAANVEIRKANAAGDGVQIIKFYTDAQTPGLDLPRDALGKLWDRLEENPVTSFLMHALTRHLAWHVELFFTPAEFARFWADHRTLPLRKIQLRAIRRDGFPHSPFRDGWCVSADMFMFRRSRRAFEDYLTATFAVVRSNPGKHSR